MKKVIILSNHHAYTYNFRKEIIQRLIDENYRVYIVLPYGEKVELLKEMGCKFIEIPLDRRGKNLITEIKLILRYNKIIKKIKPDVVLSYTIKPNIYGGIVCRKLGIPIIANVTGLGTSFSKKGFIRNLLIGLYKFAFKKNTYIFFQNKENELFFRKHNIGNGKHKIIPGSGVNLDLYEYKEYPIDNGRIKFLFIGRIMQEKGIQELVDAARIIKKDYKNVQFDAIGFYEKDYEKKAIELSELGVITFHGVKDNVHEYITNCNAVVLPSYQEGMANVLLEASSTGRPVLASNISGCKETFEEGISGLSFESRNSDSLKEALVKFIKLPYEKKREMGIEARKKMEIEFDRNIVVDAYVNKIEKLID